MKTPPKNAAVPTQAQRNPKTADLRDLLSSPGHTRVKHNTVETPDGTVAVFDLAGAVEDSRNTYDKKDKETIKWLSLHRVPKYVGANIDRMTAGEGTSHEEARWCCIEFGIRRIFDSEEYQAWAELQKLATSKKTRYRSDGDWDDVMNRMDNFPFKPKDVHTGTYQTSARIPEPIRAQASGAAKVLGMSASTLATTCIIDALRDLEDVMHKQDMNETMEEFYSLLSRRTRRLRNLLVEIEVLEPRRAR